MELTTIRRPGGSQAVRGRTMASPPGLIGPRVTGGSAAGLTLLIIKLVSRLERKPGKPPGFGYSLFGGLGGFRKLANPRVHSLLVLETNNCKDRNEMKER